VRGAVVDDAPLLAVRDLTVEIDGARVVDGVSFDVAPGEVMALVGESGCGKSLTAYALLGLLPDVSVLRAGQILLAGTDLAQLSARDLREARSKDIAIIFQEPTASLDPLTTVGAQIAAAWRVHRGGPRFAARQRARDMLADVGIPDPDRRLDQYPFELSGGMCQRIMIAIALICGPRLLVADEPTTALDVTIQAQILDLMKSLVVGQGTSIVFITHDMGVVAEIADRVAVMYAGRIAEVAPVQALFDNPAHPYTALLLASVPRIDVPAKAELATIEGRVPTPNEFGRGCHFVDRCPLAGMRCDSEIPPLLDLGGGHLTACWHSERVAEIAR
jgi:peptide/nickel transport system ATP-binding protein